MKKYAIEKKLIKPMFASVYTANLEYIGPSEIGCVFNDWHLHAKYKTKRAAILLLRRWWQNAGCLSIGKKIYKIVLAIKSNLC